MWPLTRKRGEAAAEDFNVEIGAVVLYGLEYDLACAEDQRSLQAALELLSEFDEEKGR